MRFIENFKHNKFIVTFVEIPLVPHNRFATLEGSETAGDVKIGAYRASR